MNTESDFTIIEGWIDEGYIRSTHDPIITSGKVGLIHSQAVLDAIADYKEVIRGNEWTMQNLGVMILEHATIKSTLVDISFNVF